MGQGPLIPRPVHDRVRAVRDHLLGNLVERDLAVRLALLAALSGEHVLLIGPPGTAKSLVARRLRLAFRGGACFERLLTRFTVPEEIFGPLSIRALEQDRYERQTSGYLPTATIGFLDEVFKANSAILNALLTLLNEREFDNGTQRVRTPLVSVVAASNELPEGEELDALFDRFLLRLHVGPVSSEAFGKLLDVPPGEPGPPSPELPFTVEDLADIQARSRGVTVPDDVRELLAQMRRWLTEQQILVSDRRWLKIVNLLRVAALTHGRDRVSIWDCWLLQHCTWAKPEQRQAIFDWYAERLGTSQAMDAPRLTQIVTAWERRLTQDQESRSQARNDAGQPLYVGEGGKSTTKSKGKVRKHRGDEPLYLAPAKAGSDRAADGKGYTRTELDALTWRDRYYDHTRFRDWAERDSYLADPNNWLYKTGALPPHLEPTRHKAAYIRDCVSQIEAHMDEVTSYQAQLQAHARSLVETIRSHPWVTPDFEGPATASLLRTTDVVAQLRTRIGEVKRGFERLPVDAETAVVGGSLDDGKGIGSDSYAPNPADVEQVEADYAAHVAETEVASDSDAPAGGRQAAVGDDGFVDVD